MVSRDVNGGLLVVCVALAMGADSLPRLEVSPALPVEGDTVTIRVVLGVSPSTCIPLYSDVCTLNVYTEPHYPPGGEIRMPFEGSPPPRGQVCDSTVTEYGPECTVGSLQAGVYSVVVFVDTIGTFQVRPPGSGFTVGGAVRFSSSSPLLSGAVVRMELADTADSPTTYVLVDSDTCDPFYEFRNVATSAYRLTVLSTTYPQANFSLLVSSDTVFHLDLGSAWIIVGGGVCGMRGDPVSGCTVSVSFPELDSAGHGKVYSSLTNSDGSFVVYGVPVSMADEAATVTSIKDGCASGGRSIDLRGDPNTLMRMNFVLACPAEDSAAVSSIDDSGVTVTLMAATTAYEGLGWRGVRLRYSLYNTGAEARIYDLSQACRWEVRGIYGPLDEGLILFDVAADCGSGGSGRFRYLSSPAEIDCDSSGYRIAINAGDSVVSYGPEAVVLCSADTVRLYAWIFGHRATTEVSADLLLPPLSVIPRLERGLCSVQNCDMGTNTGVFDLRGRRIRPTMQVWPAGIVLLRLPTDGCMV